MALRTVRTLGAGETIVTKGELGDEMYVVLEGQAGVAVSNAQHVTFGVGEIFGEMAVIDAQPRSATVTALADGTRVLPIDQAKFIYLVSQQPAFALAVMATLSQRLRGEAIEVGPTVAGSDAAYGAVAIRPGLWQFRSRSRACNVYLVVGGHRKVLVDTGLAASYGSLAAALESIGHPAASIDQIILTHEHADHIGGTALLPGTRTVAAHPWAANKIALKDDFATVSGVIGEHLGDFRVDVCLAEGSVVDVDPYRFEVLHTPGHTSGCICLVDAAQDLMICGDTFMAGGGMGGIFGSGNISDYILSLQRLQRLRLSTALPGHGRASEAAEGDIASALAKAHSLLKDTRELFRAMRANEAFDRIMSSLKDLNR